jgi:mycobactin lysine-N-oxygenase
MENLVVIGAGPKGIAIAAKWTAYKALSYKNLPQLIIIDSSPIAGSHWNGSNGYTDGHRPLCTSATKDLGYPYSDEDPNVRDYMLSQFSWQSFQIEKGMYQQWIGRGQPNPTHGEWQTYLQWAKSKCTQVLFPVFEVKQIRAADDWTIVSNDGREKVRCKRLVITGPGKAVRVPSEPAGFHDCILDGYNFWHDIHKLKKFFEIPEAELEDHSIAVIGSGGTAATIVAGLLERTEAPINILSREPSLYSRGESYFETKALTEPADWTELPIAVREKLIKRIDRGVISAQNMQLISSAPNVQQNRVSVSKIVVSPGEDGIKTPVIIGEVELFDPEVGTKTIDVKIPADFVIDAGGFDPWWFSKLFVGELKEVLQDSKLRLLLESTIDDHLEIQFALPKNRLFAAEVSESIADKYARSNPSKQSLHLATPMLAGLAQGPGFPNLTCLGLLSNRILEPFVP